MTAKEQEAYNEALRRIRRCWRQGTDGTLLYLSGLGLTTLPPEIGQLSALRMLFLDRNQLSTLHPEIAQLSAITRLQLGSNQLSTLPPEIGQLSALSELDLQRNQLSTLPPEIGQLSALRVLDLARNQLITLPPEIGQLSALTSLDLSGNQLSTLPPDIRKLTQLKKLNLRGNPKLGLPDEVLAATSEEEARLESWEDKIGAPERILEYYFRIHSAEKAAAGKPLLEARIIVIGDGAAGKTSLVRQLMENAPARVQEASTRDVVIEQWPSKINGRTVTAHVWDFGGQKQMHAAHPYFFTTRTLYLVVAEARKDQQDRVDYWLKMVAKYGGGARALVVVNKVEPDGHAMALDRPKLLDRYRRNLPEDVSRAFFPTSCTLGTGIDALRAAIRQELGEMNQVWALWPAEWFKVKQTVQEMREPQSGSPRWLTKLLSYLPTSRHAAPKGAETILYDEWRTICEECGVPTQEERDELLERMGHLGKVVCFPRDAKLRQLGALNPEWVTRGIYPLLVDTRVAANGGILRLEDLRTLLDARRYPVEKHPWLVDLMKAFELVFEDHQGRMLIAAQLPTDSPDWAQPSQWSGEDTLHLELRYDTVLPESVMSQFIVRRHADARNPGEWWRNGIALKRGGCVALVRAHTTEQEAKIELRLRGPRNERRELLSSIRDTLRDPRDTMPPVLHVILGKDCAPRYDDLLIHALENRELPFIINGQSVKRELAPILDLIEAPTQQAASREAIQLIINNNNDNKLSMSQEYTGTKVESSTVIGSQVGGHGNKQEIKNAQVGQLTNCTNMIQQMPAGALREMLETLTQQLVPVREEMRVKDAKEMDSQLVTLVEEAQKPEEERDRDLLSVTAKGLIEAAQTVGEIAEPVIATVRGILELLRITEGGA